MGGSGKTRTQQADVLKLILLPQPAFFLLSVRTKGPAWASCSDKRGASMVDSRPCRAKRRGAAVGKWEVGFGGRCCGGSGVAWSVWDYVPGRPASHGRGRLGRRVRAMGALADKNETEALQSSDALKGFSVAQQLKTNKQQTSISRRAFFYFLLLSKSNKEPFKVYLFEVSQWGTQGFNIY